MLVDDLFDKKSLTEAQGGGSPWHSEPEQQQMDADRRGRLGRERNAGLDEPDDAASGSVQTGNGVYEYTVPAGQESMAQQLGLQQHRGHWVSRVPIQRANFQFGQPQFHKIPAPKVAEVTMHNTGQEDYDDEDYDDEEPELRSGGYVRDKEDQSGEVFIMRGSPEDRRVQITDRRGSGWNISPSRLVPVDDHDPAIARYFGQGVAEGSKEKTPGVALSKAYQKDFDGKKPVNRRPETALTGTYSKTGKPGGELKKRSVAEAIPDVDHMHGPRGINLPVADTRDILQKPFEFYGNYKEWYRDVDRVNSELLDDNAEYTSMAGGKTISINGKDFAFWSNRNGNGSIDIGIAKKYGQQGVAEGMLDNPGEQDSPVAQAIIRRILLQRTDLLAKHGPEKVGQAVDEVADFVGDVDEIGSSDVSGWVRHVEQMLGNMEQEADRKHAVENKSEKDDQPWVDPKLKRRMDYAFGHYAGYRDKPEAFFKWVMNSIDHSEQTDQQHDERFDRIEREIEQLSQRLSQVNEQYGSAVANRFSQRLAEHFELDRPTADPTQSVFVESRAAKRAAIKQIFARQG
jgi:hypothetical protein